MNLFEIDELGMYFGEDFIINDKISISQPTIGEIMHFNERKYFQMVNNLCCIPSDIKSVLWDQGIDYEEISDFELFMMISKGMKPEDTYLLLGDIDLSSFVEYINNDNGELVLVDEKHQIVIDKLIYQRMIDYIRKMHNITPKVEHAYNQTTKRILIDLNRNDLQMAAKKPYKSTLRPLVSAMVNSAGFKYNAREVLDVGLVEFMDSVQRIPIINNSQALLKGCYSGMIDTTKIDKNALNWMKDIGE